MCCGLFDVITAKLKLKFIFWFYQLLFCVYFYAYLESYMNNMNVNGTADR